MDDLREQIDNQLAALLSEQREAEMLHGAYNPYPQEIAPAERRARRWNKAVKWLGWLIGGIAAVCLLCVPVAAILQTFLNGAFRQMGGLYMTYREAYLSAVMVLGCVAAGAAVVLTVRREIERHV